MRNLAVVKDNAARKAVDAVIPLSEAADVHKSLLRSPSDKVRLGALKLIYELHGALNNKDQVQHHQHVHLNFQSVKELNEKYEEAKRMKESAKLGTAVLGGEDESC